MSASVENAHSIAHEDDDAARYTRRVDAVVIGVFLALSVIRILGAALGTESEQQLRSFVIDSALDTVSLFAILRFTRRFLIGGDQPSSHLALHAVAAPVYSLMYMGARELLQLALIGPGLTSERNLLHVVIFSLSYAIWSGIAHGVEYFRLYRLSVQATRRLQDELTDVGRHRAEAELRAIKAEINPQFLGNTLADVSSLVSTDPRAAERALAELGNTLRDAVGRAGSRSVTLEEELESMGPFLAVQRARFGGDIHVTTNVADGERDVAVPQLILQLLADNAITHGFAARRPTTLHISADRTPGDRIRIEVACAGADIVFTRKDGEAALAQIQARLSELYGATVDVELETSPATGAVASVVLPLRPIATVTPTLEPEQAASVDRSVSPRQVAVFVAAFAVFWALGTWIIRNHGESMAVALVRGIPGGITWLAMLIVPLHVSRADRVDWRGHALGMLAVSTGFPALRIITEIMTGMPLRMPSPGRVVAVVIMTAFFYGTIAVAVQAARLARRQFHSERLLRRLRSDLADASRRRTDAELRALKAELNPHFLGNALSAVASLVRKDPDAARRVLRELGQLLQSAVSRIDVQEVTLGDEIRDLAPFLAVERARFGDRLSVAWEVDAAALDAKVPHMILQPLVENAVKHGLSAREGPGRVVVTGRRAVDRLELSVHDDGVGLHANGDAGRARAGVGLANVRARLQQLYGTDASLELASAGDAGTVARVTLPWR